MTTTDKNEIVFKLLYKVYSEGAYSTIELNKTLKKLDSSTSPYVTRFFYGVLSKSVLLDYLVDLLTDKKPQLKAVVVLKMGIYGLKYMSIPSYAVVDGMVELVKKIGKKQLSGFINATLRKAEGITLPIKTGNFASDISVNNSCPLWIVNKLIKQKGSDFAADFTGAHLPEKTHIRLLRGRISKEKEYEILHGEQKTSCGYYVGAAAMSRLPEGSFVVQSLSSALATEYYAVNLNAQSAVLDLCAAPGGKAAYLAELTGAAVTACDIHPHRVELIKSYAKNVGVTLDALVNDATVFRPDFEDKFDCVLCDVPCSGIGVVFSKPDILLNRKESDIPALSAVQEKILSVAARYVRKGGELNYSTCTVLYEENERVIERFLAQNHDFKIEKTALRSAISGDDGYVRIYPHTHEADGFFVVKLRRNG